MMEALLIILGIIIAIPVGLVVLWNILSFIGAIILDLGNIIWAIIFVVIVIGLFSLC